MLKNYEVKHTFMAISIIVSIASPLFLVFVPLVIANELHHTKDIWFVFISGKTYFVYAVGFLLLFVATILPYILNVRKTPILFSIVSVLLSILVFYVASQHYKSISVDFISYRSLFSVKEYTYSWNEVDSVIYRQDQDGGSAEYDILFHDGNSLKFGENGYFKEIKLKFIGKLRDMNIKIKRE
ncbi:hypothetical protein ACW2QC_10900 [Virgibacillus sp. FSP13]